MDERLHPRHDELEPFEQPPQDAHLPHAVGYRQRPSEKMTGYTYVTNDLSLSRDALVLDAVSVQDDGTSAVLTLHEGRGAAAPIIMAVEALAGQGGWRMFPKGVELDNGLYLDLDAHVTSATVFWRPRYEREA